MLHLTFLLRRLKPDLTFAYSIKPIIYGTLAASLSRVPRRYGLISGLGYVFIPPMGREPFRRKLLRDTVKVLYSAALSNASRAFFQNKDDIEEFLSHDLVAADKVVLIDGTGVDLDYWTPAPPLREPVTFLLAARLLREKGVVEYVKAAKLIRKKYPQTRFILLGSLDTNPGAISRAEIEAWASEGIFKWPGHVQDVRTWLARSSVYVLPSYREGVPRSTQEAMAMARPVITTDAPGCRETVIDGVNGFLVPVGNPEALAATMEKFVLEPDMIERMGQASRRIAEERFDVRKINRIILKEMEIN